MKKFVRVSDTIFKKTDLKRVEKCYSGECWYVYIAGRKDPIKVDSGEEITKLLEEVEE